MDDSDFDQADYDNNLCEQALSILEGTNELLWVDFESN